MHRTRNKLIATLLYSLLLLPSPGAWAQEISVEYAAGHERRGMYLIDIRLRLNLDDNMTEALQHGVSLELDVEIEIRQERKWLWNKYIDGTMLRYQLEHHPLSGNYLVIDRDDNTRMQLQTLEEALDYIGSIENLPVVEAERLQDDENYIGLVRAELNFEELPPPLQPATYVSPRWQMESQWYEWVVR